MPSTTLTNRSSERLDLTGIDFDSFADQPLDVLAAHGEAGSDEVGRPAGSGRPRDPLVHQGPLPRTFVGVITMR
jgi:hypothetical protein